MILAVTGATGFLGRAFVKAALAAGHRVRVLARRSVDAPPGVKVFEGSVPGGVRYNFFEGANTVVHLAACGVQGRDRTWPRATEVNVMGSVEVVRMASESGVPRVVLAGTCLEYEGFGRLPDSPTDTDSLCTESSSTETSDAYGATKAAGGLAARAAAREAGLEWWYLRLASAYGEGDDREKLLPSALAAAREGHEFEMSEGQQVREWLHVDDAVDALLRACTTPPPDGGAIVNIGTGEGVRLATIVGRIFKLAGADMTLMQLGARAYRNGEAHRLVMDSSRAKALLGWTPKVTLDQGLEQLVRTR